MTRANKSRAAVLLGSRVLREWLGSGRQLEVREMRAAAL